MSVLVWLFLRCLIGLSLHIACEYINGRISMCGQLKLEIARSFSTARVWSPQPLPSTTCPGRKSLEPNSKRTRLTTPYIALLALSSNMWSEGLPFPTLLVRLYLNGSHRRHFSWWTKYNCGLIRYISRPITEDMIDVLSAALDSGVAISIVVIFFWYGIFPLWLTIIALICSTAQLAVPGERSGQYSSS